MTPRAPRADGPTTLSKRSPTRPHEKAGREIDAETAAPATQDPRSKVNAQERKSLSTQQESAVLFGAILPDDKATYEKPLDELRRLADTAGARVRKAVVQRRAKVHASTYVGTGMVERLGEVAGEVGADLLICDNDLSPAQAFNIEKRTGRRVVDRSELILDIFAAHARTRLSKTAVELAQLEYSLPRLKRLWNHLEKQRGGIGLRGPGETQIETDRRIVKKKIGDLKRILEEIQARKTREVRAREGEFKVALVGYTNAGKSTLMRALSGLDVLVQDKLFATLDTKTAVVEIQKNRRILLSDTVGFIQKIPHHLIASFHATLEEVTEADLLLHVIDASHPDPKSQIDAVQEVLVSLGLAEKTILPVFNKIDRLEDQIELSYLARTYPDHVAISAARGDGIEALRARIVQQMTKGLEEASFRFPMANGRAIAFLRDRAEVLEERFEEDGDAVYRVRLSKKDLGTFRAILDGEAVKRRPDGSYPRPRERTEE